MQIKSICIWLHIHFVEVLKRLWFLKCIWISSSIWRKLFTFYMIKSSGNVHRTMEKPQRKQRSAVCWELSDVSYFPLFCGHDIFCVLPGAAEPQILDFVHSGPESQKRMLSSCPPVVALCWRQAKVQIPSLLTFGHATDSASLHSTLCSPVESPDFPLASGKVWNTDFYFFFSVWDSALPAPRVAMGPYHTEFVKGKPSVFSLLFTHREAHTRHGHSKLFKMLTWQRRGKLFYQLDIHNVLVCDSSRFINAWVSCCLVGGSVEGTILFLVPWSDICMHTEISMFATLSAEKFALIS